MSQVSFQPHRTLSGMVQPQSPKNTHTKYWKWRSKIVSFSRLKLKHYNYHGWNICPQKKLQSLSTVITLISILAQITEFDLVKKYHYFINKFTLSLWSMKYFKQEPTNLLDILNHSIWYNNWITRGKNYLINNRLENKVISKLKYILDKKCDFIDQSKSNLKYKVNITFLEFLNITSCIPKSRKKILNICQQKIVSRFKILSRAVIFSWDLWWNSCPQLLYTIY